MYTDFFQLSEEPFQVTPNPRYLFLSHVHREAIERLTSGVRRRKGFIEMIGMAGTGKTLLCKELVQMLSPEMDIAYLFYPVTNEQALYEAILKQWGVQIHEGASVSWLLEHIHSFLKKRFESGRNALIILDEAQNLSLSLLENLRLLSNLETESEKLLQILLTGQPEFHVLLKSGKIPQLDQRIRVRVFLEPLDADTVPLYIYHRLNRAGGMASLDFTPEALRMIHRASEGIPRLINTICERALEEAYQEKTFQINASIVKAALDGFKRMKGLPPRKSSGAFDHFSKWYRFGLSFALVVLVLGFFWLMKRKPDIKSLPKKKQNVLKPQALEIPEQNLGKGKDKKLPKSLQIYPLHEIEMVLRGLLVIPGGDRLFWGDLRMRQRDLEMLHTPVLLQLVRENGKEGWICGKRFHSRGFQVWCHGLWKPVMLTALSSWTGRCRVPFWMGLRFGNERVLRLGSQGEAVIRLQTWLLKTGDLHEMTGVFDEQTREAVERFQLREGLTPDGVAGSQTLALLFQRGQIGRGNVPEGVVNIAH